MRQQPLSTSANSTSELLDNLEQKTEEAMIVHSIVDLSDHLRKVEYVPEASRRAEYIRKEIARLEKSLASIRSH